MMPNFETWIAELDKDVIQGECGFERGEFTVFPEHWRRFFDMGLTPAQAFARAIKAHGEHCREEEAERKANIERIQREDAQVIAQYRAAKGESS